MTTHLAQNQFISNPVDGSPPSPTDTAVEPAPGKGDATAEPIAGSVEQSTRDNLDGPTPLLRSSEILGSGASYKPPSNERRPSEAPASAPTKNPDAGALGTDHIHEIFAGAQRLPPRELPPDFQERLLAAIESDVWADEPPLFLQKREA